MATQSLTDALQETLAFFDEGTPQTTSEVAEYLDLGRRSTYDRLNRLVEEGHLETKKVGGNGRVWWRPEGAGGEETDVESHREFERLIETVEEYAIFTLDTEGYVQTWNPGAEAIKGFEADEILGEHFSTFYTEADRDADVPEENLEKAAAEGSIEDEGWRVRSDGSRFWANVTIRAIRDDDGGLQGYAKVTRDMTDRREYEEQLREQRDYTAQILETAPVGVLTVEQDGTFTATNERAAELLELEKDGDDQWSVGVKAVYDEDGEFIPPEERPYVRALETGESFRNWDAQLELSKGGRRWLSTNIKPMTDETGAVERVLVTLKDITQLKEQARRLERQRDDLEAELEEVFTRVDDGFFALDEEFQFTYVNAHAADRFGYDETELVDQYIWDVLEPASHGQQALQEALETQEPVSFEQFYEPFESWFEIHVYPSENGLSVYFTDITERKERERELKRFETLFTESRDVNVVMDPDGTYRYVTPSVVREFGHDPDALVGENAFDYIHPEDRERVYEEFVELVENPAQEPTTEYRFQRADGSWAVIESRGRNLLHDPDVEGIVVYNRDVTERKERERKLEESERRYRTLVENFPNGAVGLFDEELSYTAMGGQLVDQVGIDPEDRIERDISEIYPDELVEEVEPYFQAAFDGEANSLEVEYHDRHLLAHTVPVRNDDEEVFAGMLMVQDVTERKERERALRDAKTQLEAATEAGKVGTWQWNVQDDRFVTDEWFARTFDVNPDAAREGAPLEAFTSRIHEEDRDRVNDEIETAVAACGEYETEYRVWDADDELRWVVARGQVECDEDGNPLTFPGVLTDITERKRAEMELERQREQLAALNSLNETVHDITEAAIEESTREEIEQIICDRLAESDSYEFAWIGDVDVNSQTVNLRAEAGVEGYLDGITVSVDPDDEQSQGPTGRAFKTGEMQTTRDVTTDERHDPWRDHVQEYEFRSSAAIPLVHEETIYGVLNVYADRLDAFEGQEQAVIGQLGEIVGHAIAAADRKQALMSDEVTEIEFLLPDVSDMFGIAEPIDGPLAFDRSVQIDDDTFLQYGTVAEGTIDALQVAVEQLSHFEELTIIDRKNDTARFELRLSDPPVTSAVASHGGHIQRAEIENDEFHLTIHLPPSVPVRQMIDAIQEEYPPTKLRTRRQITRDAEAFEPVDRTVTDDLTDRQRAVIEAATYAGFFEWPRESSGEEVAESLGIAPPTFSQHLRKAQGKVFRSLFENSAPS